MSATLRNVAAVALGLAFAACGSKSGSQAPPSATPIQAGGAAQGSSMGQVS